MRSAQRPVLYLRHSRPRLPLLDCTFAGGDVCDMLCFLSGAPCLKTLPQKHRNILETLATAALSRGDDETVRGARLEHVESALPPSGVGRVAHVWSV